MKMDFFLGHILRCHRIVRKILHRVHVFVSMDTFSCPWVSSLFFQKLEIVLEISLWFPCSTLFCQTHKELLFALQMPELWADLWLEISHITVGISVTRICHLGFIARIVLKLLCRAGWDPKPLNVTNCLRASSADLCSSKWKIPESVLHEMTRKYGLQIIVQYSVYQIYGGCWDFFLFNV